MLEIKEAIDSLDDVEASLEALETNVKLLEDIVHTMELKIS